MKLVGRNTDGTGERMEVLELEKNTHPYFMGAQVLVHLLAQSQNQVTALSSCGECHRKCAGNAETTQMLAKPVLSCRSARGTCTAAPLVSSATPDAVANACYVRLALGFQGLRTGRQVHTHNLVSPCTA